MAVLSGRGGNFCAGYDLKELATASVPNILTEYGVGPAPMVSCFFTVYKTIIVSYCRGRPISISASQ